MNVPITDEAELRVQTEVLYKQGGADNVLTCIATLQKCQIIILSKLNELLEEEIQSGEIDHGN